MRALTKTVLGLGVAGAGVLGWASLVERNAFVLRRFEVPVLSGGGVHDRVLRRVVCADRKRCDVVDPHTRSRQSTGSAPVGLGIGAQQLPRLVAAQGPTRQAATLLSGSRSSSSTLVCISTISLFCPACSSSGCPATYA